METAQDLQTENPRERLNNLYRFQRHFYDLTRRFFLLGRDELLQKMKVQRDESVLEIGCGTGRNLLKLSSLAQGARLFGLDASDEMLKTAAAKFDARDKVKEIILRQGLAENFSFNGTFGQTAPFDKIFISYSLSMFPNWQDALLNSLENLRAGGSLYIVDFWDGAALPAWLNRLRRWWLGHVQVYARPEFLDFLNELKSKDVGELTVSTVGRRYAFVAHFRKSPRQ